MISLIYLYAFELKNHEIYKIFQTIVKILFSTLNVHNFFCKFANSTSECMSMSLKAPLKTFLSVTDTSVNL